MAEIDDEKERRRTNSEIGRVEQRFRSIEFTAPEWLSASKRPSGAHHAGVIQNRMRRSTAIVLVLVLASFSACANRKQDALMDEIESAVSLPKDAHPLQAYGRNYAFSGPNTVTATYLIPFAPLNFRQDCTVMLANFMSRPCTKKEVAEDAASDAQAVAQQTPAGERRWYPDFRRLPMMGDGGCMQVSVEYEISSHRVLKVKCNGNV